jgi:tetratricopeptide (TPR) repeat protein
MSGELQANVGLAVTLGSEAEFGALAHARTRIGRYRVLRVLGEGGMGIVYAAYDDELARAVAIKLLRGAGSHPSSRDRMRREAQAMAQVSHPNVVQIHDVGEHDGELFLTMELIRGQTLDAWLVELGPVRVRAQRWREIVEVFVAAGRGLAAAHAAGLVHRDFKPSNVLIGEGVVKVGDFGLARGEADFTLESLDESDPELTQSSRKLAERMTETGALVGTPAYLSPEQLTGRESSAASDQFAFCVALYEALVGQRPFAGDDLATLVANLLAGRRQSVPAGTNVPGWLLAVIDRGLARAPSERWPSMDALLAALLDDPAKRRRRRLAVGFSVLGLAAILGVFAVDEAQHRNQCEALGSVLDERWNVQSKQQLADAFAHTDAPDAQETWRRVEPQLDEWTQAWRAARMAACDEGRDDPERAQQRAACLEHERWELEALLDVFAQADRATVIEAVVAVADLPEVARCDDLSWLASDVSLRSGSEATEQDAALRRDLARVLALERAGRYQDSLALAQTLVESARSLGDPVVEAEALAKLGGIRWRMSDFAGAERDLLAGHFLAGRVEDDHTAYATARDLAWVVGVRLARPSEGRVWLEHARMNLARSGGDPESDPDIFVMLGEIEVSEGHLAEALAAHERALALRLELLGEAHPEIADSLVNLGWIYASLGQLDQALATLERGRGIFEAALGPSHPMVSWADNEIARVLLELGRADEGIAAYRRSIATRERALGPNDPGLATTLSNLAAALSQRGELLESLLLLERAVTILEHTLGLSHPDTLSATINFADAKAEVGELEDALELLERTLERAEQSLGRNNEMARMAAKNLAYWLEQRGDDAQAIARYRQVLAIDEATYGPDHPQLADDLDAIAKMCMGLGEYEQALASYQRAADIRARALPPEHSAHAKSLENIDKAMQALGRDRDDEPPAR